MATDHNMQGHYSSNPEVSYERRDLGARNILLFFAVLFIVGVIVHFVIWGVYGAMERVVASMDQEPNPVKPYEPAPRAVLLQNTPMVNLNKFAEPRLQSDEPADMSRLNAQEDQILNGNAWIDEKGVVHLPIDVAMDEIARRGLPVRSAGPAMNAQAQNQTGNAATNSAPAAKQ